ncbi:MAG TPA: universal stress protein [Burkholderiaceae bacterium]|nr:universal stress protein [Burkholderiaceae bacterium]
MFQHILLPLDGSDVSARAARRGIAFARSIKAEVTLLHVTPVFRPTELHAHAVMREAQEAEAHATQDAHKVLDPAERIARAEHVACFAIHRVGDRPWEAIVAVAAEQGCDLILMASHGHSGVRALVLGSTTNKVVAHAKVPVLVWR